MIKNSSNCNITITESIAYTKRSVEKQVTEEQYEQQVPEFA